MYFTNGDHRAFESLMWDKPGDQYDSGADGPYPECRSCRCHRPFWTYRFCLYPECPFTPGRVTAIFLDIPLLPVSGMSLYPRARDRHRPGQSAGERR